MRSHNLMRMTGATLSSYAKMRSGQEQCDNTFSAQYQHIGQLKAIELETRIFYMR